MHVGIKTAAKFQVKFVEKFPSLETYKKLKWPMASIAGISQVCALMYINIRHESKFLYLVRWTVILAAVNRWLEIFLTCMSA